jgi:hypothetical protein
MLLGNHELMNAAGDFRYVTPAGQHDFDDAASAAAPGAPSASAPSASAPSASVPSASAPSASAPSASAPSASAPSASAPSASASPPARLLPEQRGRFAALGPGGTYARRLAQHEVITIVGDTIFSHAGVLGDWVTHVDDVNQTSRCWLDGQSRDPPAALTSQQSPVWTRAAGHADVDCAAVRAAFTALSVHRMVVGHTVQLTGITSACDGTLWRIDVGLARAYGGPIQVLELAAGAAPKILSGAR